MNVLVFRLELLEEVGFMELMELKLLEVCCESETVEHTRDTSTGDTISTLSLLLVHIVTLNSDLFELNF
jgi:hypothetical protein